MNAIIANILRSHLIESQDWVDVSAGLVKEFERVNTSTPRDGARPVTTRKKYPVSCDYTAEQCNSGKYIELVPRSTKRCITYFEDFGGQPQRRTDQSEFDMIAQLRLVGWINMQKFNSGNACSFADRIVIEILSKIPVNQFNDQGLNKIKVEIVRIVPKNASIFARYTYDESIRQYLLYPYDYFAIDLRVSYTLNTSCFDPVQIDNEPCSPSESSGGYTPPVVGAFTRYRDFYTVGGVMAYNIPELSGMSIKRVQFGSFNLKPEDWTYNDPTFTIIDPNADTDGSIYVNIEYQRT